MAQKLNINLTEIIAEQVYTSSSSLRILNGNMTMKRDMGFGYSFEYCPQLKTAWFGKTGKMAIEKVENVVTVADITAHVERWENWIADLKMPLIK